MQSFRRSTTETPTYHAQLIAAYTNCRDALNTFQAEGESADVRSIGGKSTFNSEVAVERFVGQTWILEAMITEAFKTESYRKTVENIAWVKDKEAWEQFRPALELFHAVTELFEEQHIWKQYAVTAEV